MYGANKSLLTLLLYLKKEWPDSIHTVIAPNDGVFTKELKDLDISYNVVSFESTFYSKERQNWKSRILLGVKFFTGTWRLFFKIKEFKPELIYTNTSVLANGLFISKILGVKHIWHIREFGLEDYGLLPIWGARIQKWLFRKSDQLIFNSDYLMESKCDDQMKMNAQVVYNGVYSNDYVPTRSTEIVNINKNLNICFIGLLQKEKNVQEAIKLLASLKEKRPEVMLYLCGSGEKSYLESLKNYVRELGVTENVNFMGYLTDVAVILGKSHFLIMPSKNEAMGRVTVEALFHGVPVIGRDSAGTSELFENGVQGFLYTEVSEVASRVLTLNQNGYEQMQIRAKEHAVSNYSIEEYGERILNIIAANKNKK